MLSLKFPRLSSFVPLLGIASMTAAIFSFATPSITTVPPSTIAVEVKTPWLFGSPSCGQTVIAGPARIFHWSSSFYHLLNKSPAISAPLFKALPTHDGQSVDFALQLSFSPENPAAIVCSSVPANWLSVFIYGPLEATARTLTSQQPLSRILYNSDTQDHIASALSESVSSQIAAQHLPFKLTKLRLVNLSESPHPASPSNTDSRH